ncbi:MAG: class I SAM-dependent DNA methyltransferase [Candidatus Hermodarchaeota archaeon]
MSHIASRNALTAEKILNSLEISQKATLEIFKELGLTVHHNRYVISHLDSPLNTLFLDIQPNETHLNEFIINNLIYYRKVGGDLSRSFDLVCLLTQNALVLADLDGNIYGTSFRNQKENFALIKPFSWTKREKKKALSILASLATVITKKTLLNAENFASQFGKWSLIGIWAQNHLLEYLNKNFRKIKVFYEEWEKNFSQIYQKRDLTIELFIKHTYLAYLVKLVLLEKYAGKTHLSTPSFSDLVDYLNNKSVSLFADNLFDWAENVPILYDRLYNAINEAEFDSTDVFCVVYQQMVSPSTRYTLGEFYTPPELAKTMVDRAYELGKKVLDPSCGSGTFLVEIIKRIRSSDLDATEQLKAIEKVYGFDINPIAVAVSKANILLQIDSLPERLLPTNVYLCNSLFPPKYKLIQGEIDLVIGNPPWLVLNRVHSIDYKNRLKELARDFRIDPKAHQIANLEMSALFLYAAKEYYLRNGGKIFFIVSNAFMTGNNHAGTRQFHDFKDIIFWKFDRDIFNIHNICLLATYEKGIKRDQQALKSLEVKVNLFGINESAKGNNLLTTIKEEEYTPYDVEERSLKTKNQKRYFVRKLIPKSSKSKLLKLGPNPYGKNFFKGGDLFPRNLVFIEVMEKKERDLQVNYEIRHIVSKNAKVPWDFDPIEELTKQNKYHQETVKIEGKFIYQAIKSTDVVPFLFLKTSPVFLPIEVDEEKGGYRLTKSKDSFGWKHFQRLTALYKERHKEGASITDLWTNLNWQEKLTQARQRAPVRVAIQASGTLVKATVITEIEKVIIDCTNVFIGLDNLSEAYYLSGYLNSPLLTESIRVIQAEGAGGGGRHILKRPFEFFFPKFDQNNTLHINLSKKAQEMEKEAQKIYQEWLEKEKINSKSDYVELRPLTIQNRIYEALGWDKKTGKISKLYQELNELVKEIINQ